MWFSALVKPISDIVNNIIDKFAMDEGEKQKLKAEITFQLLESSNKELEAAANIIIAEAKGDSWLQRSWRPILMLWFAILVGMSWFGIGADHLSDSNVSELFGIIKIGLGGYIVGRSGEKIVKTIKEKV